MRSDRRILPLVIVFVILIAAVFYRLQDDESLDGLSGGPDGDPLITENQKNGKGSLPPRLTNREPGTSEPAAIVQLDPKFARDTKLEFGNAVQCGDATAIFDLVDQQGVPLIEEQLGHVQLWRKLGKFWVREHAEFDEKNCRVICAGYLGGGLEPGEYELGVHCKAYGALWKKFAVAAGQRIEGRIQMPNWRRFIHLRYVDANGGVINRISSPPRYTSPRSSLPRRARKRPGRILAEPPLVGSSISYNDAIGVGTGGASGSFGSRSGRVHLTDNGIWHLEVFAGANGTLTQSFSRTRDGRTNLNITSDFNGPEWESYEVKLERSPTYQSRIAKRRLKNEDNPGDMLAFRNIAQPEPDPANPDQFMQGIHRVIFNVNSGVEMSPKIQPGQSRSIYNGEGRWQNRVIKQQKGKWYADVFSRGGTSSEVEGTVDYWYSDGALLRTANKNFDYRGLSNAKNVCFVSDTVAANRCILEASMPTRTSSAWARGLRVGWSIDKERIYKQRINQSHGNRFSVRSALALAESEDTPLFGRLHLSFFGEGRTRQLDLVRSLDDYQTEKLKQGSLNIQPNPSGIILRAVDEDGAGLPWVEASLIPIDKLHLAFSIQKRMKSWQKNKRQDRHYSNRSVSLSLDSDSEDPEEEFLEEPEEGSVEAIVKFVSELTDADLRKLLKDGLYEEFASDEERRFFSMNYTWYNTHRRLKSDRRGYLIDWKQSLKPGQRFAIFLWSNSRDHLISDGMVLFTAQEGLTDLGAVRLPDYE